MTRRDPTRLYDPEHDRLWAAIRRLTLTVIALGIAVLCLILVAAL